MQPLDLFVLKRRHRGCIYLCNHSNMNLLSGSNMKGVSIYEYFYWIQQRQTLYTLWQNLYRGWHRKRMELQKNCWRTWQEPFLCFQEVRRHLIFSPHYYDDFFFYRAKHSHDTSLELRSSSRSGINLSPEELDQLNRLVSPLIKKGQPLSHIFLSHMEDIPCCQRTLYSYVDKQYLSVINLDLPRKVRYKKRKKKQLDTPVPGYRKNRTYRDLLDFLSGCFWSPAAWTWPTDLFTAVSDNTDRQREFFPGSFIIWDAAPAGCPYKGLLLRPHVLLAERTPGKESWVYTLYPPKRNFFWLSYWTECKPYDESHQQHGKSQPEWLHSIPAGSSSAWCKTDESHGSSISSRWPDPPQAWSYKITNAQI